MASALWNLSVNLTRESIGELDSIFHIILPQNIDLSLEIGLALLEQSVYAISVRYLTPLKSIWNWKYFLELNLLYGNKSARQLFKRRSVRQKDRFSSSSRQSGICFKHKAKLSRKILFFLLYGCKAWIIWYYIIQHYMIEVLFSFDKLGVWSLKFLSF